MGKDFVDVRHVFFMQKYWRRLRTSSMNNKVERQNGKRGLESGGSAGYVDEMQILEEDGMVHNVLYLIMSECGA